MELLLFTATAYCCKLLLHIAGVSSQASLSRPRVLLLLRVTAMISCCDWLLRYAAVACACGSFLRPPAADDVLCCNSVIQLAAAMSYCITRQRLAAAFASEICTGRSSR